MVLKETQYMICHCIKILSFFEQNENKNGQKTNKERGYHVLDFIFRWIKLLFYQDLTFSGFCFGGWSFGGVTAASEDSESGVLARKKIKNMSWIFS